MNINMFNKELYNSLECSISFNELYNSRILIVGASGMIGSCLVDLIMQINLLYNAKIHIYAMSRNKDYLKCRFNQYLPNKYFTIIQHDISKTLNFKFNVDYIINAASNADPLTIINNPVNTIRSNFIGMDNLIRFSLLNNVKRLLYISSGEMYGLLDNNNASFSENYSGYLDYSSTRSCYPSGKRATEMLCQSYIKQFNCDIVIARPCHTYGPTMKFTDSRAICEFLKRSCNKKDIILKSNGSLERSHCYVIDSAIALLYILLLGECGQAYNIADKASQCTIKYLAETIAYFTDTIVKYAVPTTFEKSSFSKVNKAVLDAKKLENLGWKALTHLDCGLKSTIAHLKFDLSKQ